MGFFDDEREERSWYDTAQVCLNGHMINSSAASQPVSNKKFCPNCGAATVTACPKCNAPIKGYHHIPGVVHLGDETPQSYCDNCGSAYPWTEAKLKAAGELAAELDNLTPEEKDLLTKSLPDLIRDTPGTSVAATRFKKLLAKARDKTGTLIWEAIKDVATDAAKKIILGG